MLIINVRFAQLAAVVCKMDVSRITTQQIVYKPVDVSSSFSIAGCLSIAAFKSTCPGNSTRRFFSSQASAHGIFIWNCVSSIAARENPPFAILAIFKARHVSDCSSCTRPPCLAIVADMLKTYKEISCCIYILDTTITSTMYASIASSNVVNAYLVHCRGFLSLHSSAKIPELATSWCLIA